MYLEKREKKSVFYVVIAGIITECFISLLFSDYICYS